MPNHEYYMQLVLELARATQFQTRPNPQVAALLVKNQQIVGIGCHLFAGEDHAEVHAIRQAGERAAGATLYVNLEPCSHFGKTPPCADAIINAKIAKVVVATLDPNPLVVGSGLAKLRAAGIAVELGILAEQARQINQVFFHNIQTRQPFVTIKVAMSLDGKIASKNGHSQWITGVEARSDAHGYRISHDAILTGVNSVITDDPSLTPHLIANPRRKPIRIILDSCLRTPLTAKLLNDNAADTWILTANSLQKCHQAYLELGARVVLLPATDVNSVLNYLYQQQICSLLVEGGEQIYASFIEASCVNQVVSYISPQLIGSREARHFFAGNGFDDLNSNLHLKLSATMQLGNDLKLVYLRS